MGRPPCCDKVGIKKGPWTPEEDIILVSYIQQHGPGNWRSVPTNTGLLRCSKSCRLRWTNYLRPGIKRGNFTPHEEGMIIHLQSLMGNKWAAIASYLPQRTDNDIKNYWNTHLKKKIKKYQSALDLHQMASSSFNDKRVLDNNISDHHHHQAGGAVSSVLSCRYKTSSSTTSTTTYASSTENISRLLEGWMRNSPKITTTNNQSSKITQEEKQNHHHHHLISNTNFLTITSTPVHDDDHQGINNNKMDEHDNCENLISHEEFESLLSFENMGSLVAWEKSSSDSNFHGSQSSTINQEINKQPPISLLEKWLLDDEAAAAAAAEGAGTAGGQVQDMIELSPITADDEHDHDFSNFL